VRSHNLKSPPPVAAVYDCRTENDSGVCGGGLRPSEKNEFAPIVAAVCDRRIENETGAHRDAATEQSLQKPRLRCLVRIFMGSPVYFLTARTADRQSALACAEMHQAFADFCHKSLEHGAWEGRYVLMTDHLHLFVSVDKISLPDWVKSLKNTFSKTLRALGCEAPHWQQGFFDHLFRSGESYSQKWDYLRENPVRARLVESAEDWPFAGEIHDLEYRK
jgi:putative transposase